MRQFELERAEETLSAKSRQKEELANQIAALEVNFFVILTLILVLICIQLLTKIF